MSHKFNFLKISIANVEFKFQYKLIKITNNFLSYFFDETITTLFTPRLSKRKIKFDKILIGYANEIYNFNKLNNPKIKKFFIVNDEWIFNGFSHFTLYRKRFRDILIKQIQYFTSNILRKKLNDSKNFYELFDQDIQGYLTHVQPGSYNTFNASWTRKRETHDKCFFQRKLDTKT